VKANATVAGTCQSCGREFSHRGHARYCPECRPVMGGKKATKYAISESVKRLLGERYDGTVRGRAAEIAATLGWPAWAVKKAARALGLAQPRPKDRRDWTDQEVALLERWAGLRSAQWIARRLQRGETSVILKMTRMRISRRVTDGYSVRDLAECMGVDHHSVDRWIADGLLAAGWRVRPGPTNARKIEEDDVITFLRTHRDEYELRKVDQEWFLRLVFDRQDSDSEQPGAPVSPLRVPDPTAAQIAARAKAIRRANGELPQLTPGD